MENFGEKTPIDRQEVINRLKDYGVEEETTRNLLSTWVDQIKASAETLTDHHELNKARIENEITIAKLYIESGYFDEAWDSLNETIDYAVNLDERGLVDEINKLLDEIEEKLK